MKKSLVYLSISVVFFLSASSAFAAKCTFSVATTALSFGTLNQANPVDVNVSATMTFTCKGGPPGDYPAAYSITHDSGMYELGPGQNRMMNGAVAPAEYLPYTIALNPTAGSANKNVPYNFTVTGTVKGVDYQDLAAGLYSDTVVITILP